MRSDPVDVYGRTLAYLYRLPDGLFVNEALARDGYVRQLTVPPNVARAGDLGAAVAEARDGGRGLWAACPPPPPTAPPPTAPPPGGGCHPSYEGACVPIASDVDCGGGSGNGPAYVYEKRFRVVGPDVYGLDADNDGIACER